MATEQKSRLFVTGFGPFSRFGENPSGLLAEKTEYAHRVIEVAYAAVDQFLDELNPNEFDILVSIGVSGRAHVLNTEMFARNFAGRYPDVRGASRFGTIDSTAPLLLNTTLWKPHIIAEWMTELPVETSFDAGNYLCNYIYFEALRRFPSKRVGFLHVPSVKQMPLDRQFETLTRILSDCSNS